MADRLMTELARWRDCPQCEGHSVGKLLRCPTCGNRGRLPVLPGMPLVIEMRDRFGPSPTVVYLLAEGKPQSQVWYDDQPGWAGDLKDAARFYDKTEADLAMTRLMPFWSDRWHAYYRQPRFVEVTR